MKYVYKFLNFFSASNPQQFEFNPLTSSCHSPITQDAIERRESENHELNIQDALNIDVSFYYYFLYNKEKLSNTARNG